MPEYLYRFRSASKLLDDKYQELERQEIFFASPNELNDPMEGFKDIYWVGDAIVWKNLLKHYLLCLERICALLLLSKAHEDIDVSSMPVFETKYSLPAEKAKAMHQDICDAFFSKKDTSKYPGYLANRAKPVRRDELVFYLRMLHPRALESVYSSYKRYNLISDTQLIDQLDRLSGQNIESLRELDKLDYQQSDRDLVELFCTSANKVAHQYDLIHLYNSTENPVPQNKKLVFVEFPNKYVEALERIVHPEWYAASFVEDYRNSSMWGHYGDSHEGVCLKFSVSNCGDLPSMKLHGITGWASNKDKSGPTLGDRDFQFRKVDYSRAFTEIDFFKSLGRLPMATLREWYRGDDGSQSICAGVVFDNENKWREGYWDNFYKCIMSKLDDWKYEGEHRLMLSGMFIDYKDQNKRKYRYRFKDLDGIIFGINTSQENKLRIMNIIKNKCHVAARSDFKFYQAVYSSDSGQIEASELELLKLKA